MRILRGKSNLEVSSQGFALFVVGLVLATFLGGAIRTILRSDQVHQRIVNELRTRFPRHEFQIGSTQVLLSSGFWPGLGLQVKSLTFKQDVCGKLSFLLEIPEATLPVDLLSLRKGQLRLGDVQITGGRVHLDYRDCPATPDSAPPVSAVRKLKAGTIEAPKLDWQGAGRYLEALDLKDFTVTYERNVTWKLAVQDAELEFDGDDMEFEARVLVQKSLPFGMLTHAVTVNGEGNRGLLSWIVDSEFKEGRLHWEGRWDLTNNRATTDVRLNQLPLKDVLFDLHQMGFLEHEVRLKSSWLSCVAHWEGEPRQLTASPISIQHCKMEGGYGRIELPEARLLLGETPSFSEPAVFRVQQLQLQPIAESLGRQILPRVLSRLGAWSGVLEYSHAKSWRVDGHLENLEIVFSNQSVRGKQSIRRMHTLAQASGANIQGRIDEVIINDGEFLGHVGFLLNESGREGSFQARIDRLTLSPGIQQLILGGKASPVGLSGDGVLQAGELSGFNGKLTVSEVSGEGWSGEGIELNSKFVNPVFHVEGQAKKMQVQPTWRFYPQLKVAVPELSGPFAWQNASVRSEIQRAGGVLSALSGVDQNGVPWRGRGQWVRDGEFTAVITTGAGGKAKAFAVRGEKGALVVRDEAAPVR